MYEISNCQLPKITCLARLLTSSLCSTESISKEQMDDLDEELEIPDELLPWMLNCWLEMGYVYANGTEIFPSW